MTYEQMVKKIHIQIDSEKDIIRAIENSLFSARLVDLQKYNSLLDAYATSKMIIEVLEKLLKE